jgi:S1-C subfamily serine protease
LPVLRFVTLAAALAVAIGALLPPSAARAQESAWVQVEALRTLSAAQARARAYGERFDNVAGFRLGSGWYAVALGPFAPPIARAELVALRNAGQIPSDSYISDGASYGQRFWPVGAGALAPPATAPTAPEEPAAAPDAEVAQPAEPEYVPDETPDEARRNELLLSGEERREVQEALQWFGHYSAGIDGAFGRGTRAGMAEWQQAQGYPVTGVLTTAQRAELIAEWRAPFDALGLAPVRSAEAGIEMVMPTARVAYARTEAPFVHYDSTDGSQMRVLLISQAGDEATLFGLYDIMQTLAIVPAEGPRERSARAFTIRGTSPGLESHTEARLEGGAIKGFTFVWSDGEPRVIESVIEQMQDSFTRLPAVLPDAARAGDAREPSVDLLAGLELRRPEHTRTGFFVDAGGAVLTTAEAVSGCSRVTLGGETEATVAAEDAALGLALLRPDTALAPRAVAAFRSAAPRIRAEVAVAGFSYGDALSLPLLTYGTLADTRGLGGEESLARLELAALPGDSGGPVLDSAGGVVGALTAGPGGATGARRLPEGVAFAVGVPAIVAFLSDAGLSARAAQSDAPRAPEALADLAADMAVQVNCWN